MSEGGIFCGMEVGWHMSLYVGFEECSSKTAGFMIFFILRGGGGPRTTPDAAGRVSGSGLDVG